MMRILVSLLVVFLSLPLHAKGNDFTQECSGSFQGQKGFNVSFKVKANSEAALLVTQTGNLPTVVLWKTGTDDLAGYSEHIFKEATYDSDFEVLIVYSGSDETYYRRSDSSENWQFVETKYEEFKSGSIEIGSPNGTEDISDLSCGEENPEYVPSDNAQYEFGIATCTGGNNASCSFGFKSIFESKPLLFIMPTIDPQSLDDDLSANLSVTSVSQYGATVIQEMPDRISGNSEPMKYVSYLAIEPGIAYFDGNQVFAGYTELDNKVWISSSSDWKTVNYSSMYGRPDFSNSNKPIVLTEIQTRENGDKWITAAQKLNSNGNGIQLSLELSRSKDGNNYDDETMAYLLAEPQVGKTQGYDFVFNSYTSTGVSNASTVIQDSCSQYVSTGLPFVEGVVGSKQERAGSHGGWLRRCSIQEGSISFAVDEDDSNRTHISEDVGYFAFSKAFPNLTEDEECSIFPAPAQSLVDGSASKVYFWNVNRPNITGWPESYLSYEGGKNWVNMGYQTVPDLSNTNIASCEIGYCRSDVDNKVSLPSNLVMPTAQVGAALDIQGSGGQIYSDVCKEKGSSSVNLFCEYTESGNTVTIDILRSMNSLTISNTGNIDFVIRLPAQKGFKIAEYHVRNSGVETQFSAGGEYYFDIFQIHTSGNKLTTLGEVDLYIGSALEFSNGVEITQEGDADSFNIYAEDASVTLKGLSGSDTVINAKILSNALRFSDIDIKGAVTANDLYIQSDSAQLLGNSKCFDSGSTKSYELDISPTNHFALLCEDPTLTFTVKDKETNQVASDYSGKIEIELPDSISITNGSSDNLYTPTNGILNVILEPTELGEFSVQGTLVSADVTNTVEASSDLYIAPYKIEADPVFVIAGQDTAFELTVLACDDDTFTPRAVESYDADSLTVSLFSLETPDSNVVGVQTGNLVVNGVSIADGESKSVSFSFEDGTDEATLNYDESGEISFQLSDPDFVCPIDFTCETESDVSETTSWDTLKGSVNVYVRPWKFAICDPKDLPMNGSSSSGTKYKKAGEEFSIQVKPVVYSDSVSSYPSSGSDYCSLDVTKNYFLYGTDVYLTAELATPVGGRLGTGSSFLSQTNDGNYIVGDKKSYDSNSSGEYWYLFEGLYWDEVGSLTLIANLGLDNNGDSYTYLGGEVTGSRDVGRFVPDHLTIIEVSETVWDYADDHSDFAYMGQDIEHNFIVQAESSQSDSEGSPLITTNYGRFGSSYISTITYRATANIPDSDGNDNWENVESSRILPLNLAWSASDWGSSTGQITVRISDFSFVKNGATLDGPFNSSNSNFGLVSSKVDEVDFKSLDFDSNLDGTLSGQRFSEQPDFRYGRMVLDDVGGNEGTNISIPLRVEYWDESSDDFIQNSQDSGSVLNSTGYCTQVLWSELSNSSNVSLGGASSNANVQTGEFSDLYAQQSTSAREQVKVWLRQGDNSVSGSNINCYGSDVDQPWLQYYWNETDEEDPSAVVTFGIYRGNDRVIFRGENRFTGQ